MPVNLFRSSSEVVDPEVGVDPATTEDIMSQPCVVEALAAVRAENTASFKRGYAMGQDTYNRLFDTLISRVSWAIEDLAYRAPETVTKEYVKRLLISIQQGNS